MKVRLLNFSLPTAEPESSEPESSEPAEKAVSPLPPLNYAASQAPLAKLPSPRPARKSLLSVRPGRNLTRQRPALRQPSRAAVTLLKPSHALPQTAPLATDGTGHDGDETENVASRGASQKFVWEQTLLEMNAAREEEGDDQGKCQTQ